MSHSSIGRALSIAGNRGAQRSRFESWWGSFFDQLSYKPFFIFKTCIRFFELMLHAQLENTMLVLEKVGKKNCRHNEVVGLTRLLTKEISGTSTGLEHKMWS